jgi:hypothetical protein
LGDKIVKNKGDNGNKAKDVGVINERRKKIRGKTFNVPMQSTKFG